MEMIEINAESDSHDAEKPRSGSNKTKNSNNEISQNFEEYFINISENSVALWEVKRKILINQYNLFSNVENIAQRSFSSNKIC